MIPSNLPPGFEEPQESPKQFDQADYIEQFDRMMESFEERQRFYSERPYLNTEPNE